MFLIFKENSISVSNNSLKKSKAILWPKNDDNFSVFLLQNVKDLQSKKQITYIEKIKIPNTNKTYSNYFNVPKNWFEIQMISLVYQQNSFPLNSIALDELCHFENLRNLSLEGYSFPHFPLALNNLKHIEHLSLNSCEIEEIGEEIYFPALNVLKLEDNKLSSLPLSFQKTPRLYHLNISKNDFNPSSMRKSFYNGEGKFGFNNLFYLYIEDNNFSEEEKNLLTQEFTKKQKEENGCTLRLLKDKKQATFTAHHTNENLYNNWI